MKLKSVLWIVLLIIIGFNAAKACTSIVAGKDASADGSVLFGHNEDDSGRRIVNIWRVERQTHAPDEVITLKRGAVIPQVRETAAYTWFQMPDLEYSDFYMNEWSVTVASNACLSREDTPETVNGGIGFWLRRIVAERARSAKEGVRIAGALLDSLGYAGSGRTLVICDPNEGWLLSMIGGKYWLAWRVPDDAAVVLPNRFIIGDVDFSDSTQFIFSRANLREYALQRKWFDPKGQTVFNFAELFNVKSDEKTDLRQWRGQQMLLGKSDKKQKEETLPAAIKPKKKITVQELMRIFRDHYENTDYAASIDQVSRDSDSFNTPNPNRMEPRPICTSKTQYGIVCHLRNWMPWPVGAVAWLSFGRPDCHPYLPWYVGQTVVPTVYQPRLSGSSPDSALAQHFQPEANAFDYDPRHTFWVLNELEHMVDVNYAKGIETVVPARDAIENRLLEFQPDFERSVLRLWEKDRTEAHKYINDLNQSVTDESLQKAKWLIRRLKSEFYQ